MPFCVPVTGQTGTCTVHISILTHSTPVCTGILKIKKEEKMKAHWRKRRKEKEEEGENVVEEEEEGGGRTRRREGRREKFIIANAKHV